MTRRDISTSTLSRLRSSGLSYRSISREVNLPLATVYNRLAPTTPDPIKSHRKRSKEERERIVKLAEERGFTNREISEIIGCSVNFVAEVVRRYYRFKLI